MWRAAICLPIPSFEPTRVRTLRPTRFAGWERPKARERAPPPGTRGGGVAERERTGNLRGEGELLNRASLPARSWCEAGAFLPRVRDEKKSSG